MTEFIGWDEVILMERGKRVEINPVDDAALIYTSSAQEKYNDFFREMIKHPHKLYEYHTGTKLSPLKRIYMDAKCKFVKSSCEKQQKAINKAIKPFIRKK